MITFPDIIIIAVVEGLTEYLPVSSTAHMIFTTALLGIDNNSFIKVLLISIQLGAIAAVLVLYRQRFFRQAERNFYLKLGYAVLPALILGPLLMPCIELAFGNVTVIALVLIAGGIILLVIDRYFSRPQSQSVDKISPRQAFLIGLWQCLAMMPGVSRSAASIIGGMQQGLSRELAALFSFFLAVPTMGAATAYALFLKNWQDNGQISKGYELILSSGHNTLIFLVGTLVAFAVALLAIKVFISLVQQYGFKPWGWYRIAAGIILLFIFNFYVRG